MAETAALEEETRAAKTDPAAEELDFGPVQSTAGPATAPAEPPPGEPLPLQSTIGNAALARAPAASASEAPAEEAETAAPAPAAGVSPPAPAAQTGAAGAQRGGPAGGAKAGGAASPAAPAPKPAIPARHYDFSIPAAFLAPTRLSVPRAAARGSGYDPEHARLEARSAVSGLRATASGIDAAISAAAEARKRELTAAAAGTRKTLVADIRRMLALVRGEVASAKATVAAMEIRRGNETTTVLALGPARVAAETIGGLGAVDAVSKKRVDEARLGVTSGQTEARDLGRSEGARGKAAIDGQAAEAWRRGQEKAVGYPKDERGELQAEAVLRIAAEASKQLANPGPELQEKIEDAGETLDDGFDDADDQIVETIETQSKSLKDSIGAQAETLTPHFDQVAAIVATGMADVTGQASESLSDVETAAVRELTELEAATVAQLNAASAFGVELIDAETQAVLKATSELVTKTAQSVEALENPAPSPVNEAIAATESVNRMAGEGFVDGLRDIGRAVDDAFESGASGVAEGTAEASAAVSSGLADAVEKVDEGMGLVVGKTEEGVDKIVTEWRDALANATTSADKEFETAVKGLQEKVDTTVAQARVDMAARVTEAVTKNREGLDQLDSQMEKAADEAGKKYDAPWYEKLGRWLWNALKGLVKALLALLVILAGLVIGIILIFVGLIEGAVALIVFGLIVVAVVVGYAIYLIGAGIYARIRSAETWYQGVWGFAVGVLDIVGVPNVIEGLIGRDLVTWRRLTTEEAGERFGGGLANLLPLKLKGAKVKAPVELPHPIELPHPVELPRAPLELPRGPELPPTELARAGELPRAPETVPAPEPVEVARPVEQAPKPVEEAPRPVEEAPKPAEEPPKPAEEAPKPAEPAPKPAEEPVKPAEDAPKPAEEPAKPAEEPAKQPVEEQPKKPVEDQAAPTEETLARLRERKKLNDSTISQLQRQIDKLGRKIVEILDRRTRERGDPRKKLLSEADELAKKKADLEGRRNDLGRENGQLAKEIGRVERHLNPDKRVELPCFAADTLVWTRSGTVRIDELTPGDIVLARDLDRGETVERYVEAVLVNATTRFHEVEVAGETILATGDHRFWVESLSDWVAARELAPGMLLRLADDSSAPVERRRLGSPGDYETFNLRIETTPTYFVGPGALVHNDGPVVYEYGVFAVYEGVNPEFPGKVYIGLTNDVPRRQGEHRELAIEMLKTKLSPKQQQFFEFMKGVQLRPRAAGLSQPQAEYMEQINIDIEAGEGRAVNRKLKQVAPSRMQKLRYQITKALGKCPP